MVAMHGEAKTLFVRGPSVGARFVVLALLSIVLMVLDHRMHHLETVRDTLSVVVYPVQYLADLPVRIDRWARQALAERHALVAENRRLAEEHLLLQGRLQQFEALRAENARLRTLLGSSQKVDDRVLIAELLSVDLDPYKHEVMLNKGSIDGAFVGQAVLDARGVMGQLTEVGPISSTAMLITDPSHALPVQFVRTGIRTIAVGTGKLSTLDLPNLPSNVDVRVGDLVVTSGLGQRYPPGYPVAVVSSIRLDPAGSFAQILAGPTGHLNRAREVLLVWSDGGGRRESEAPANPDPDASPSPDDGAGAGP
jgi:rod shape-determining protein MreC